MNHQRASSALENVTVLDLTRVRAGPAAVRQLADWGADVIMVEMPEALEGEGSLGGDRDGPDFVNLHRNKRSITLNLKSEEGVDLLKRLVRNADVLVENFRPDVKVRLGIDYDQLSSINPRLVYASISGFGQTGPYADRPGFDQVIQGMGGLMSITGLPGQGPVRAGIPVADLSSGLFCAYGILLALFERERSGRGQWVETSLLHSQIFMLDFQAARWLMDREVPRQAGNNHPTTIPTGVFETSNGHINLSVVGDRMWKVFCHAAGLDHLAEDERFATTKSRLTHRDQLNELINQRTCQEPSSVWIPRLNEAGVPCGPIYSIDEVFSDEQVHHLRIVDTIESAERGKISLVSQPVGMSRTPSTLVAPPPRRGQHNGEIFGKLGLSGEEVENLKKRNII